MILTDDQIDYQAYLAEPEAKQAVKPVSNYRDAVVKQFLCPDEQRGVFLPWRKSAGLLRLRRGELTLWPGINGHGKALGLDTPIPTLYGWKTMGDMAVGDIVFDENGKPCRVLAATEVMLDRECFEIEFSDGTKVVADADHEWLTKTQLCMRSARQAKKRAPTRQDYAPSNQEHKRTFPKIVTTRQIASTLLHRNGDVVVSNHSIPVCSPLVRSDAVLPIDPYILGVWLGDGHTDSASLTSADSFIVEQMVSNGISVTKRASTYAYGLTGGLQGVLRRVGLLGNKHVPEIYLRASASQRLALLQGLMDTDGCITDYGRCEFTSTNKNLAESCLELVMSLGILAKMIGGRATLYGKDCGPKFRVTFTTTIPIFRLPRKAAFVPSEVSTRSTHRFIVACNKIASVPVRCIQVSSESHLYLATRAMIPTHNSLVLSQVMISAAAQGEKVLIASMEMRPVSTISRMVRQAAKQRDPSVPMIDEFHEWSDNRIWIYDHLGSVDWKKLIAAFRWAADKLEIKQFVIDSLMRCGIAEDDYNEQKQFVDALCTFKHDYDVSVHLVLHSRKREDEMTPPGKFDAKGSGTMSDLADNVMTVWRNKRKERELEKPMPKAEIINEPDALLICDKQRNFDWEGRITLWYDRNSMQFVESLHGAPTDLMEIGA